MKRSPAFALLYIRLLTQMKRLLDTQRPLTEGDKARMEDSKRKLQTLID